MTETDYNDRNQLLRSSSAPSDAGIEKEDSGYVAGIKRAIKQQIDRGLSLSGRRFGVKRSDRDQVLENQHPSYISVLVNGGPHHQHQPQQNPESSASAGSDMLSESAPPEWALLLIGCLLGLATGLFVAAFNHGVHVIHEWAWAGTPNEGASWLRLQRLADTWHRVLLIPVTGGVMVGVLHGLLEILDQIRQSRKQRADPLSSAFPVIKAIQAAITLGTGCSLGPEGPSVDIGKSCGNGFSLMMENNRERRIALVAAGAAAGIASGFNAAVAGCFFSIETVLRPLRAENSPPFTTAMIILASVISSTVSNVLLGERPAFTVPAYELKSAAELPLYLILGMLCGAVGVVFTRMADWCARGFEFAKQRAGLPAVICPALGGLGAGVIALRYPGILYWGFTNVDEILHTGKSASAPGIWLLAQLVAAKVAATALCKGSGLVGGLYAPSLMIGAAVGAVFGGVSARLIDSAIPANATIAQPQAYALVGMAATLASVCSVPLTSVLLLFELTKDYRILLPLMGAVGLAIWVPSVTSQTCENQGGYRSVQPGDVQLTTLDRSSPVDTDSLLEGIKVSKAVTADYLKVSEAVNLDDALSRMQSAEQNAVLVVDADGMLVGILTRGDVRRYVACNPEKNGNGTAGSACTRGMSYRGQKRGLLTCYVDSSLGTAKELMEARGIKQLPVLSRRGSGDRRPAPFAVLYHHSILACLRREAGGGQVMPSTQSEGRSESH